jgi:hypothetical protein
VWFHSLSPRRYLGEFQRPFSVTNCLNERTDDSIIRVHSQKSLFFFFPIALLSSRADRVDHDQVGTVDETRFVVRQSIWRRWSGARVGGHNAPWAKRSHMEPHPTRSLGHRWYAKVSGRVDGSFTSGLVYPP